MKNSMGDEHIDWNAFKYLRVDSLDRYPLKLSPVYEDFELSFLPLHFIIRRAPDRSLDGSFACGVWLPTAKLDRL